MHVGPGEAEITTIFEPCSLKDNFCIVYGDKVDGEELERAYRNRRGTALRNHMLYT